MNNIHNNNISLIFIHIFCLGTEKMESEWFEMGQKHQLK